MRQTASCFSECTVLLGKGQRSIGRGEFSETATIITFSLLHPSTHIHKLIEHSLTTINHNHMQEPSARHASVRSSAQDGLEGREKEKNNNGNKQSCLSRLPGIQYYRRKHWQGFELCLYALMTCHYKITNNQNTTLHRASQSPQIPHIKRAVQNNTSHTVISEPDSQKRGFRRTSHEQT